MNNSTTQKPNLDPSQFRRVHLWLEEVLRTGPRYDVHADEDVERFRRGLMSTMGVPSLNGPINVDFLAEIDDQDVSLFIDAVINFVVVERDRLHEVESAHPGVDVAVWFLIATHGADALYKALEANGRMHFRDRRFGSDLGL